MIRIEGFHGTDSANKEKILDENFSSSIGDKEWLGDGAYFFCNGITTQQAERLASKWAIAHAYDKSTKSYKYNEFVVIKAIISVEESNLLDLTNFDGLELFNYMRNKYIRKIEEGGVRLKGFYDFKDGHLINDAREKLNLPIYVVKGNFYIKFAVERKLNINFRVPNSTIIAVFNPLSLIEKESLEPIIERKIKLS